MMAFDLSHLPSSGGLDMCVVRGEIANGTNWFSWRVPLGTRLIYYVSINAGGGGGGGFSGAANTQRGGGGGGGCGITYAVMGPLAAFAGAGELYIRCSKGGSGGAAGSSGGSATGRNIIRNRPLEALQLQGEDATVVSNELGVGGAGGTAASGGGGGSGALNPSARFTSESSNITPVQHKKILAYLRNSTGAAPSGQSGSATGTPLTIVHQSLQSAGNGGAGCSATYAAANGGSISGIYAAGFQANEILGGIGNAAGGGNGGDGLCVIPSVHSPFRFLFTGGAGGGNANTGSGGRGGIASYGCGGGGGGGGLTGGAGGAGGDGIVILWAF